MKRTPIIKIRPIRGVFDSDWDGVPNDQDCVWWDRRRQHDFSGMGIGDLSSMLGFLESGLPKKRYASVLETGGRAEITGKDYGGPHGKPMKYAQLMGGKRLVMSGPDKGKII